MQNSCQFKSFRATHEVELVGVVFRTLPELLFGFGVACDVVNQSRSQQRHDDDAALTEKLPSFDQVKIIWFPFRFSLPLSSAMLRMLNDP